MAAVVIFVLVALTAPLVVIPIVTWAAHHVF
jgi:hypothetical protein